MNQVMENLAASARRSIHKFLEMHSLAPYTSAERRVLLEKGFPVAGFVRDGRRSLCSI